MRTLAGYLAAVIQAQELDMKKPERIDLTNEEYVEPWNNGTREYLY